jgi:dihydroorotate dehydrogenase
LHHIKGFDDIAATFGRVWDASGVRGFFGRGYRFHRYLGPFGPDFTGSTFVAKTSTYHPRDGNTPLLGADHDFEPKETFPKSVYVGLKGLWTGNVLNAWGLSGPGLKALVATKKWQQYKKPYMISIMTVAEDPAEQMAEMEEAANLLRQLAFHSTASFAIQLNLSCPNTNMDPRKLILQGGRFLDILERVPVPVAVKVAINMPLVAVAEISAHKKCAVLSITNTVVFMDMSDKIDWEKHFGKVSPLPFKGGGGLSGPLLLPLAVDYIRKLRNDFGVTKHINGGGGIFYPTDALTYFDAGADSVSIGSMAMTRPWRVGPTIDLVKAHFGHRYQEAA